MENNWEQIKLKDGRYALVDKDDYDSLMQWDWHTIKPVREYVVKSFHNGGRRKNVYMHRLIMKAKQGQKIDHINGNGLDNRKSNLRFCTTSQNRMNSKLNKNNKSGYRGVWYEKRWNTWIAALRVNGKQVYLGSYKTPVEAAEAYNFGAAQYHKEFATFNNLK